MQFLKERRTREGRQRAGTRPADTGKDLRPAAAGRRLPPHWVSNTATLSAAKVLVPLS